MPFVPVSKSYSSSGPPISSYLPPGSINSMLLGRLDIPGGLYSGLTRSPLSSLGGYGYGLSSSSSIGLSSSSIGISSYSSSSSPKLGKRYGIGLNPISEHSTQRVSRPPKFNHISAYSKPFDVPSSAIPRRPVSNRFATFNTEDIDVTRPRRPSRDETVETNDKRIPESQENEPEEKMATPGDISRDRDKSFGTIRRNRTVIRIQTHHLKENPYLVTEEKPKKPKKTAGEKLKEKWAIQSKKKKHSGYRKPSLTDIQAQQEALRREIEARQAALMQRRAERAASITNESGSEGLTKSQEDEFFSNPEKIPRRKSTKKFLIVRQMSKENVPGTEGLLVSPDVIPIPISRSGSTAGLLPVEISIPEEDSNGKASDNVDMHNEDDDEVDFWATPALRSKRSTMVIRAYFKPIAETETIPDSGDVASIHEEDEENCDLEIESIMKAGKELEDAKQNDVAQQLKQMKEIFTGAKLLGMDQDQEKGTGEAEQELFMDVKNKTVKKVKKKSDTKNTTGAADTATGGKTESVLTESSITACPGTQAHASPLANETQSTAEPVISSTDSAEKQMPLELSEAPETEAKSKCKPKPFQLSSDVKESPNPSPSKITSKSGLFNKFDSKSNTSSPVGFRKPEFVKAKSPGSPKSEFVKPQSPFSSRPAFVKAKSPSSPKVFSPIASESGIPKFDETTEAPVAHESAIPSDESPVNPDDSATETTKAGDKCPQQPNAAEDSQPEVSSARSKANESTKQELSSRKTKAPAGTKFDETKAAKSKAVEPIKTDNVEDTTKTNQLNQIPKDTPLPVEKSKAEDIKGKPVAPKISSEKPTEGAKLLEGKSKVEGGKLDKKLASETTKAEGGKMTDKSPSDKSKPEAAKTVPDKVTEAKLPVVGKAAPGKSTTEKVLVDAQRQLDTKKPQVPEQSEPTALPEKKDRTKVEVPKSKPNNDPLQKAKTAAKRTDSPARKPWDKPEEAKKAEPPVNVDTLGADKLAKDVMSSLANKTSDPKGIIISNTKSMSAEVAAAFKHPAELTDKHPATGTVSTSVNENREVSPSSLEKGSESKLDELKTNTTPTNTDRSSPLPASENQVETRPKKKDNKDATSQPSTAQSPVASKQTDNNTKKPPTKQIEKPKATSPSDKASPMNKVAISKNKKNAFGLQNRWNSREDKRNTSIESSDSSESIVQLKTSVTFAQDEAEHTAQHSESKAHQSDQGDEATKNPVEKSAAKTPKGKKVNPKSKATEEKPADVSSTLSSQTTVKSTTEVETVQIVQTSEEISTTITSETTEEPEMITTVVLPNPIVQGIIRDSLNRYSSEGSSGSVDGDSPPLTPKSSERDGSSSTTSSSTLSAGTSGSSRRMPSPPSDDSDEDQETIARRICPTKTRPKFRRYEVDDFQFLKVLGKGSFGKVLLAELKGTDCYFAIKCLKKDVVLEDDDVECTMIERKVLLMGSKHPYLCHLLCTFQTESHLFFVMEYLNGGDLMFHIQQTGRFTEDRARFYGAEIVSGLKFLHKKGIIYRDLKLDNILLDFEGHVRIADFGMCKLQIYLDRTADTFCGTPDYMAPEIIKGLKYNQCVDWWAFGILLYEMLIGQSPFSGCDEDELFWSICNESVRYPRFLSREAKKILEQLLEKDASKRLGSTGNPHGEVKEQPFFAPINWDKLERRELDPPFKPKLKHSLDVQYFDTTFTKEAPRLTPVDKEILRSMDQTQFDGFSYTNPHTTD